jgi:tetratricopeptide (TPR) repeat protein
LLALFFDANLTQARDTAELALALAPHSPKASGAMVWQLLARQEHTAALVEADRALCANPTDAYAAALMGIVMYLLRSYDEACLCFAESLRAAPLHAPSLFFYACAQYMMQRYDDALLLLNRMPDSEMAPRDLALRGCIALRQGRESVVKHTETRLAALPFHSDISIAAIHVAGNDLTAAAASLTRALDTREPGLFLLPIDPMYEPLQHSHPLLMATIRKGRQPRCDRCATPLAQDHHRPYALRLCDSCESRHHSRSG